MAQLEIRSAEERLDGTGMVAFDVWAQDDNGLAVPGLHKTVLLHADVVTAILAEPTAALKKAKAAQEIATKYPEFSDENIELQLNANNQAAQEAANATNQFNLPVVIPAA